MLGTPVSLLVGIVLLLGAVVLFFLDKLRPAVARESDKVYAVFILMAGLLALAIQEITLGESFQMMLMAGMLTTLYIENVGNREPREIIPGPPVGNRPPVPRYDNRPPVRRGYRAELDDRPEFRGPMPPRMNPAQPPYRPEPGYPEPGYVANRGNGQVRPPYEEYRGPAGRLQPSRPGSAGAPPDNRYTDNGRYGDRPPVPQSPPQARPQPQPQPRRPSAQRPYDGPPSNTPDSFDPDLEARTGDRPPSRPRSGGNDGNNGANDSARGDAGARRDAPSSRALNVRPLSEAPKFDDDYRPGGNPEGAPSY